MKKKTNIKKLRRIALYTLLALFVFFIALRIALSLSTVQTFITGKITAYVFDEYGVVSRIDRVDISFFDNVILEGLYVEDHRQDTLAYIGSLEVGVGELLFQDETVLRFPEVSINSGQFNLKQYQGDTLNNLSVLINSFNSSGSDTSKSASLSISCNRLQIQEFSFRYNNENDSAVANGIDWSHLKLDSLNLDFEQIAIVEDTIEAQINLLALKEQSGFHLKDFSGKAHFSPVRTSVQDLHLVTNNSQLDLQLGFEYDSIADYSDFIHKISLNSVLDSVQLHLSDLGYFVPELIDYQDVITAKGKARGTVSNLSLKRFSFGFGERSFLNGSIDLNGLPALEETFIMLNLKALETNTTDIASLPIGINKEQIPEEVHRMGTIAFKGSFTGFINDFVAYGTFSTAVGTVNTDLKVNRNDANTALAYSGSLSAQGLDLGQLFDQEEMLGSTDFDLEVHGSGTEFEAIDAHLDGKVARIELNRYVYNNIALAGDLKNRRIQGDLTLNDPNGNFLFDGSIDLANDLPVFSFYAKADQVRLFPLHLSDRDSNAVLSTAINFNFTGNSINNIIGTASLDSIRYLEHNKKYSVKQIELEANQLKKGRELVLTTDHIQGRVSGKFNTAELPSNAQYIAQYIIPAWFSNTIDAPKKLEDFDFSIRVGKETEVLSLLSKDIQLKDSILIKGNVNSPNRLLSLQVKAPDLGYGETSGEHIVLDVRAERNQLNIALTMDKLRFSDDRFLQQFALTTQALNDSIELNLDWNNKASEQEFRGDINLSTAVKGNQSYEMAFRNSEFVLADTLWTFAENNAIYVEGDSITVNNFRVSSDFSGLSLEGTVVKDTASVFEVGIDSLDLSYLNSVTEAAGIRLSGLLDGTTRISGIYGNLIVDSDNHFEALTINDQPIGTGNIRSEFDNAQKRLNLNGELVHDGIITLDFKGSYFPLKEQDNIDLSVGFRKLGLEALNPILEDALVFNKGEITGNLKVNGSATRPELTGGFEVLDVSAHVDYLNTTYFLDKQKFIIEPDWFGADVITIKDINGKEAHANITILHNNFENLDYDIFMYDLKGFQILNTSASSEEMYYGSAYLSGYASVSGTFDNLIVGGNLTTDKNTYIAIPLDGPEDVAETPFIVFKGGEEQKTIDIRDKVDLTGIQMNFDLEITPDAKTEIIFDKTAGDVITAVGTGDIALEINTNGSFRMYGTYEVSRGEYLFTLENIINKKFSIVQGGLLSWKGDPYEGRIDMRTEYKLRTAPYNLNLGATLDSAALRQRIPVSLFLDLTGNYTDPDISFSFGLPQNYQDVESILNNLEEGQKNKQAFTLLLLNNFLPLDGTVGENTASSNALGKSSSEFLSNQLSNWLSQISDDFDIGVNYRPGDQISSEEVEVALSTQLFNDRVALSGNFGVAGNGNNPEAEQTDDNFIGDFRVEYKISQDGKLRGTMYNETNATDIINENQARYTQGVGILYQEQFNTFSGFWCRIRQRILPKEERNEDECIELERRRTLLRQEAIRKEEQEAVQQEK